MLSAVIVLNWPVRLIIVFAIIALFVIVLMDARDALINVVLKELTTTELRMALVITAVVALRELIAEIVLNAPIGAEILTPTSVLTFRLLMDPS